LADKKLSTGGNVMAHAATYRIQLRYNNASGGMGIANIVNSPCHPPSQVKFAIEETGICDEE
jgi:RecA/RadA recombinase